MGLTCYPSVTDRTVISSGLAYRTGVLAMRLLKVIVACAAVMMGLVKAAPTPDNAAPVLYFPTTVGTKWVYERDGKESVHVVTGVETKNKRIVVTVDLVEDETRSHVRTIAVS